LSAKRLLGREVRRPVSTRGAGARRQGRLEEHRHRDVLVLRIHAGQIASRNTPPPRSGFIADAVASRRRRAHRATAGCRRPLEQAGGRSRSRQAGCQLGGPGVGGSCWSGPLAASQSMMPLIWGSARSVQSGIQRLLELVEQLHRDRVRAEPSCSTTGRNLMIHAPAAARLGHALEGRDRPSRPCRTCWQAMQRVGEDLLGPLRCVGARNPCKQQCVGSDRPAPRKLTAHTPCAGIDQIPSETSR